MDKKPYPSELQDRFIVRMPDGMRDRIRAAAEASNRSMNAQIVHMIEEYFRLARWDELRAQENEFEDTLLARDDGDLTAAERVQKDFALLSQKTLHDLLVKHGIFQATTDPKNSRP